MHFTLYLTALAAPLATLAAPTYQSTASKALTQRQTALEKPPPCVRDESTTLRQTKKRSKAFTHAFIYKQNITEAFTYIVSDYINHNPFAQNGSDSAWSILSPIWASQNITPLRTTFQGTQSWLSYNNSAFGEVVDRFRWEGGCIVEHWDQGEVFPVGKSKVPV
ncbi:SnoaL-like polyketide cyclase family protein [Stagonosporopsis vannaccii]|nr:SnoaL-like polyketide cyclase family protein [Stagonosporopsis vannaccii]